MATPLYSITVNGEKVVSEGDITSTGDPRLIELTITDEVGFKSDTVSFVLDDSDNAIKWPRSGVRVAVQVGLGFLVDMGVFTIDGILASGPPDVIRIQGKAASFAQGKSMQNRQSASYEDITLLNLAKTVAGKYGLEVMAADGAGKIILDHVDQTNESDLGFLNRIAQSVGYIVKPCMGKILLDEKFSGKTITGKTIEPVVIDKSDVSNWTVSESDKDAYGSVVAEYRDTKAGGTKEFVMGDGEPELRLPHVYANKINAKKGAETKLKNIQKSMGKQIEISMPTDGTLFSGLPVRLTGFKDEVNGDYFIFKITHTLKSGLVCVLTAVKRYEEPEK